MKNKLKKALSIALALTLSVSVIPTSAAAAGSEETTQNSGYVLMNIPYDEFYAAEGVEGVDAVTTATVKTYNTGKAAGSYHEGYDAVDPISDAKILGVTYPVYVEDLSVLEGRTKVTAEDTAAITVASGKSALTTREVSGADLLIASGTYAYYVLDTVPASYKILTVNDGTFSFSEVSGSTISKNGIDAELKYACHYTDIEFIVSAEEVANASKINAVTLTADGEEYALRHVENVWDGTDLGWNWEDLDGNGLSGKTITNVTYYLQDTEGRYGIYSYDVNLTMKKNPGNVSAEFKDAKTVSLNGIPSDIQNAKATVSTKVGRGETATVIADSVEVVDGKITTTTEAQSGTYVIAIVSENYGDISVEADLVVPTPDDAPSTEQPAPDTKPSDAPTADTKPSDAPTAETKPSDQPTSDTKPSDPPTADTTPSVKKGQTQKVGNHTYKVTKEGTSPEVAFVKSASKVTKITIPETVKINGVTCKVTSIAANALKNNNKVKTLSVGSNVKTIGKKAFYNCKNLKKVTIKSTKITSVGKKAFSGIQKKATITVPKSMKKAKKNALIKKIEKAGTPKNAIVK